MNRQGGCCRLSRRAWVCSLRLSCQRYELVSTPPSPLTHRLEAQSLVNLPQLILIAITQLLKQRRRSLRTRSLPILHPVHPQMVADDIRHSLCIGCGAGPTAPNGVVYLRELVGYTVRDIGAGCGSGVCAEDDAVGESYGHDGGSETFGGGVSLGDGVGWRVGNDT